MRASDCVELVAHMHASIRELLEKTNGTESQPGI